MRRATNIDTQYPQSIKHSDFDERNRADLIEEEPSQLRKGRRVGGNTAGAHVAVTFTAYPSEGGIQLQLLRNKKTPEVGENGQKRFLIGFDSLENARYILTEDRSLSRCSVAQD